MKVHKTMAITSELTQSEAITLCQVANWGRPVAKLISEQSTDKEWEGAVDNLIADLYDALEEHCMDEGE